MKKRFMSLLLCLGVLLSLMTVSASAAGFRDVKAGSYCEIPVEWAATEGITGGYSDNTFRPNNTCTRAQILTFLWRAAGSPKVSGVSNPFVDVKESAYYYGAALWAREEGFVSGTKFAPDTLCTRAATVEYFWKYAGSETVENVPFSDVNAASELAKAVSWAVEYGITNGTSNTTFSPNSTCTRGQIVTFLHRYFVAPLDNSAFIESVREPSAPATPSTPAAPSVPSQGGSAESAMSNASLVEEYEKIQELMEMSWASGEDVSDEIYEKESELWEELSKRCEVVANYDSNPTAAAKKAYDALVAAYGDAEVLRNCDVYEA